MKILSLGNFGTGWDGSICDEEHIAKALEWEGHTVDRIQREGYGNLPNKEYDFVLLAQWDGYPADYTTTLRLHYGDKIVYWAFDYQADGQLWHEQLIEGSKLYLSKRVADSKYPNWQWLSQDFAPEFLDHYHEKPERDIEVLFTGSYLPWATERNEILKAVDERFNLRINSVTPEGWKEAGFTNVQGPVMDHQLTALVARAKVNLSIDHTLEAGYWSDRNAQIMACGGFVLFRYVPLSESVFHDRVAYFYDTDDCITQLNHYLDGIAGETERKVKASLGYTYAHENLMVRNRVRDLLTIVRGIL